MEDINFQMLLVNSSEILIIERNYFFIKKDAQIDNILIFLNLSEAEKQFEVHFLL